MRTGKNGRPKADPVEHLEELLDEPESFDFEAAPPTDDGASADHAIATLAAIVMDISGSVVPHARVVTKSSRGLVKKLQSESLTACGVRLAIVDTWERLTPFAAAKDFEPPEFEFGSASPLGRATSRACDAIRAELKAAAKAGRPINKVLLSIITDCKPNGESPEETRQGARDVDALRNDTPPLNCFGFFVGPGEPGEFLRRLSGKNPVIHAAEPETGYRKIFEWLAGAIRSASQSMPGEEVEMPELPPGFRLSMK